MNSAQQKKVKGDTNDVRLYLNMEHLLTMAHGDQGVLRTLIQKGITALEENRANLEKTIRNNPVGFRRELHKLKGSLGIMEPQNLYPLCSELDRNFLTLSEEERESKSKTLLQGVEFLLQELKGVSMNDSH